MGQTSVEAIQSALYDVDYPASKEALIDAADRNGAGGEVLRALRSLPVEEYGNLEQVIRSVDTVEASGQSAADKAVRARARGSGGVAEHMRDAEAPRLDP
jgi:hypothetical protein